MDDPGKVIVALSVIGSLTYTIRMIVNAWLGRRGEKARLAREDAPQVADERMTRLEQAVDAIAFEVERISEGQRFTTRLLSEQSRAAMTTPQRELSTNTPH